MYKTNPELFFSPEFYTFSLTFWVFIIYISQSQHVARRSFGIGSTWPISKRGNKWEMLSYEAWTDGRTAVCNNKPVFWQAYKNEWPISWNYEYIIFGQIIFQNFHQFKAFVGLSDCRTIGLSDYSSGPVLENISYFYYDCVLGQIICHGKGGVVINLFIIFTDFYHSCSSYLFVIRQQF
jgi:hypothetical protein